MEEGTPLVAPVVIAPPRRRRVVAAALTAAAFVAVGAWLAIKPSVAARGMHAADVALDFVPSPNATKDVDTPPQSDGSREGGEGGREQSAAASTTIDDDDATRSKPKKSKQNYNRQRAKMGQHVSARRRRAMLPTVHHADSKTLPSVADH